MRVPSRVWSHRLRWFHHGVWVGRAERCFKIYTHVLNRAVVGDKSPADLLFFLTSAMDGAGTGNCG